MTAGKIGGDLFNPQNSPPQHFELTREQRLTWLQLIRSENVGPATFRDLINHFGTASAALEALPQLSQKGGKRHIRICTRENAEAELEACERKSVRLLGMGESAYPNILRHIDHPPPLLSVRGRLDLNKAPGVGIVGARNASLSGIKLSGNFAKQLSQQDFLIISGFARGIDAQAHRESMKGNTIGVLAGGVDVVFPPEHDQFYEEMLENGNAFVSEMPLGFRPRAVDFPRRNRLIAGMSLGVLIVEAAKRSGSLITARLANEMGRLVFAIPGSPLDPRSSGANHLLKGGALMATDPSDIVETLTPMVTQSNSDHSIAPNNRLQEDEDLTANYDAPKPVTDTSQSNRTIIVEALGPTPNDIDEIIRHTRLPVPDVLLVLLELRIAGRLEDHPGNKVSLLM